MLPAVFLLVFILLFFKVFLYWGIYEFCHCIYYILRYTLYEEFCVVNWYIFKFKCFLCCHLATFLSLIISFPFHPFFSLVFIRNFNCSFHSVYPFGLYCFAFWQPYNTANDMLSQLQYFQSEKWVWASAHFKGVRRNAERSACLS